MNSGFEFFELDRTLFPHKAESITPDEVLRALKEKLSLWELIQRLGGPKAENVVWTLIDNGILKVGNDFKVEIVELLK